MPSPNRGEVWIVDLGMAAKIRPCLVLNIALEPQDRVLVTVIPHTRSVQGTRFEVAVAAVFLKPGVFDTQQLVSIPRVKFVRRIGRLDPDDLATVEDAVRFWLGF